MVHVHILPTREIVVLQHQSSVLVAFASMALSASLVACGSSTPPAKAPSQGVVAPTSPVNQIASANNLPQGTQVSADPNLAIAPNGSLIFPSNQPVSAQFLISGDNGRQIIVGLMQGPTGATLTDSGENVTLSWQNPQVGSYTIQILLRDAQECAAAEGGNSSACVIGPTDSGNLGARSYDKVSNQFTLQVTAATTTTAVNVAGSNPTGAFGSNSNLINQIIGLSGNNGNTASEIAGVLNGLTGGQLQGILGQLQSGAINTGNGGLLNFLRGNGSNNGNNFNNGSFGNTGTFGNGNLLGNNP